MEALGTAIKGHKFMELKFNEPTHTYTFGEKNLPSVTQICRFAYPDAYSDIPENDKAFYFSRGSGVHKLTEDVENGIDGQFTYDPEVEEYRAGHSRFLRDTGFRAIPGGIELRVKNLELGYAGTLDRIGTIQNRVVVLDYKTSSVKDKPTSLQLALYLLAIPGYKFSEVARHGVALQKGGKYKMSARYPDHDEQDAIYWATKFKEARI